MNRMSLNGIVFGLICMAAGCNTSAKKPGPEPLFSPQPLASPSGAPIASPRPDVAAKREEKGTRLDLACENAADKRAVTVVPTDKGCELHYSKFGQSSVIASSEKGATTHCDRVQEMVRKNLETAGFKCR